jgi:hypothetical protein
LILSAAFLCACSGGGSDPQEAQSTPPAGNGAPAISGTPVTLLWEGDVYAFQPSAVDPDNDALSFTIENRPRWAAFDSSTGRLHGTPATADIGLYRNIRIRVSDDDHDVWLPAFDLTVDPVSHGALTLSWLPPTENTDDTPLDDLVAFKIYWGRERSALANKVAIQSAQATSYFFDGLAPGMYYFATAAVNSFGIESELSELVTIVVR